MTELLKLKLEELIFDIAVAECIAIEQSYKDVEAEQSEPAENPVKHWQKKRNSSWTTFFPIFGGSLARTHGSHGSLARSLSSPKVYEGVWKYMKVYEGICGGMKVFEAAWKYMKGYEGLWRSMKVYGDMLRYMKGYEGIWRSMKVYQGI